MIAPSTAMPRWRAAAAGMMAGERELAEETAVALVYDGVTQAVTMATPADLPDFTVGFSLAEGAVQDAEDIEDLEVIRYGQGIEL